MLTLHGYQVEDRISCGLCVDVYGARRQLDDRRVVIKVYRGEGPGTRAELEQTALVAAAGPQVPRVLEVTSVDKQAVLVLERVSGVTADRLVEHGPLPLDAFVKLALQLAGCLTQVHGARVVHGDIRPEHVLVEQQTGKLALIGFAAARVAGGDPEAPSEEFVGGGLPTFQAPEASGRMNRRSDHRSDLYSLGATFYFLLNGAPPFVSKDPLELTHAHMAQIPESLESLRPDLPRVVSRIVMRLLNKEPSDRYQSAASLLADLERCENELERTGSIRESFVLGSSDAPIRPDFSDRFYGREGEQSLLERALERCAAGVPELWIVSGPAGVGKSRLATSLKQAAVMRGGALAMGKFDPYQRDVPHLGWICAFREILDQKLAGSPEKLTAFAERLRTALGSLSGALAAVLPELCYVLGEVQREPSSLESKHVHARLALTVQRFLSACATPAEPLVLVLDDVQWADVASLQFLEEFFATTQTSSVLVIANRQWGDADSVDQLEACLGNIERRRGRYRQLELGPLCDTASAQMLADAFQQDRESTQPLAQLIARKTGKLPLLIRDFVEHLYDLGWVTLSADKGWYWDAEAISSVEPPESAVSLLASRIERLSGPARRVIEVASCIGHLDLLDLLSELSEQSPSEVDRALEQLSDQGLIRPLRAKSSCEPSRLSRTPFGFAHDRIREAAYGLLTRDDRMQLHYQIARAMSDGSSADSPTRSSLTRVDHFNRALPLVAEDERKPILQLNIASADRALASGAAATAQTYLEHARSLFRDADWERETPLGISLYLKSAACAHHLGDSQECLRFLEVLDGRPLSPLQRALAAAQQLNAFALSYQIERAVAIGLAELRRLGVRFPLHPSRLRAYVAIARLDLAILAGAGRGFAPSLGQPEEVTASLVLSAAIGGPAARIDPRLVTLIAAWATRRILSRGYVRGPQLALAALGANMCGLAADGSRGLRYARLAEEIGELLSDPINQQRSQVILHGQLYPWVRPRCAAVEPLLSIAESARELGDREFALYASAFYSYTRLFAGIPLPTALERLELHNREFAYGMDGAPQSEVAVRSLIEPLSDDEIGEELKGINRLFEGRPELSLFVRIPWILTLTVLGNMDAARDQIERLGMPPTQGTWNADLTFLRGIVYADCAQRDRANAAALRDGLSASIKKLSRWARHGPDFVHLADFLRAERAAVRGRSSAARAAYAKVIVRAQQRGYTHHAALAAEREARLLLDLRRESESRKQLVLARKLYEQWGALAKAERLATEG